MKAIRDPENIEVGHLVAACALAGKRILEIGCGSGKLTRQYASLPLQVVGIDIALSELHQALIDQAGSVSKASLLQAAGEALPFPSQVFDITLFASSL